MHIGLVGGMATGKSTLAETLQKLVPELFYAYLSRYAIRIPSTLQATTHPDLLKYSREDYIRAIIENQNAPEVPIKRPEMDALGREIFHRFGETIVSELALHAIPNGRPALLDNIAKEKNVKYLQSRGIYVVGLHCSPKEQLRRRLATPRDIDPKNPTELEKLIKSNREFMEADQTVKIANVRYNTEEITPEEIAQQLIKIIRK